MDGDAHLFVDTHLLVGTLILGSGETTGSSSSDETDLSTGGSVPSNGRRHTCEVTTKT